MEAVARLLQEVIGLDPASIGMSAIERAVHLRFAACKVSGLDAYLHRLHAAPGEVQALVETVVVPETWFFRDPKAFSMVAEQTREAAGSEKRQFLCIPCSTGEEPYSLAMTLLDAGISPERFQIDALDVSERVLAHARDGLYGRNSFRGREVQFRDRYFEQTGAGWILDPAVRQLVRFHRGNLLEETSLPQGRAYDAIFCRNLLIYFDGATQRRAILALERLLAPQGLLCVGPAETGLLASHHFTHTRVSLAFAFRKGKTKTVPIPLPLKKRTTVPPPTNARIPASQPRPILQLAPKLVPPPVAPPAPGLDEAARLADKGHLEEVASICHAFLKSSGASAQAYYLLGLVSDAAERADEAATYYRKALYLNPQHHDALLHCSLLAAKRGDARAAQALRERAHRSTEKAA